MTDDKRTSPRRQFLKVGLAGTVLGTSGCMRLIEGEKSTPTPVPTETPVDLTSAQFEFEYDSGKQQVTITYNGGASLTGGNLQIRESGGKQVLWPELGSTIVGTDEQLQTGATAVLGPNILNWGQAVAGDTTIRLVYTGKDTPATLGRFTPPETTTLTTTVPPTDSPTETPRETVVPTDTPTSTPDTTPPSISAFSIANPSGQQLRVSFDSSEQLSTIQVNISGAESVTLATNDFALTNAGNGRYTYETTYSASSSGDFTATLDQAIDANGNNGASSQSVTVSVGNNWNFYEDFEQYSIGTKLSNIGEWERIDDKENKYYSIEKSFSNEVGGQKAVGTTSDSSLFQIDAKNTGITSWSYPDTGFKIKGILSTEGGDNQPNVGVVGEDVNSGVEIDNHPYNGREIRFSYFDNVKRISREFKSDTYEIEVVGKSDQTIIASVRAIGSENWDTFSAQTTYSGEIRGVYINTNNGGQIDSIRLRKESDPQPSGNVN